LDRELLLALLAMLPPVLWFGLVVFLILKLRDPIRTEVLPRLSGFGFAGFNVALKPADVNQLVATRAPEATNPTGDAVRDRAARNARVVRGGRVLWNDAEPLNNVGERAMLYDMGIFVEIVRTPDEAFRALGAARFDVVLSNIGAGEKPGLALLQELRDRPDSPPVVFYVEKLSEGVPAGAFGITNRPDELLHLVLDVLERTPEKSDR